MAGIRGLWPRAVFVRYVIVVSISILYLYSQGQCTGINDLSYHRTNMELPHCGSYSYVVFSDIDCDGDEDLVAGGYGGKGGDECTGGKGIDVWLANEDTAFSESSEGLPETGGFGGLAIGDIDVDGLPDIIAAGTSWSGNKGIHIFINQGHEDNSDLKWGRADSPEEDIPFNSVALKDVNGDGFLDLAAGGIFGLRFWLGSEEGWLQSSEGLPGTPGDEVTGIALTRAKFNGDEHVLLAAGSYNRLGLRLFGGESNDGIITWRSMNNITALESTRGDQVQDIIFSDLDGDDNMDLVCTFGGNGGTRDGIRAWRGISDGSGGLDFQDVSTGLPEKDWYFGACVEDLDGDGAAEIIAGSGRGNQGISIWYYMGDGDIVWREVRSGLPGQISYFKVDASDVDGDGLPDIVGGAIDGGITLWSTGDGDDPEDEYATVDENEGTSYWFYIAAVVILLSVVLVYRLRR